MNQLAVACEAIASTASRGEKIALLAAFFRTLSSEDLARAVEILTGARKLSIGHATLRAALEKVTGWDLETIATCYRECGDSGETISLLCQPCTRGGDMTLTRAVELYAELRECRNTATRVRILCETYRTYCAPVLKFWIKGITGNLRIGLQEKMVEEAIAKAHDIDLAPVRAAANRNGDLARIAVAARTSTLDSIEARLYHPMDFMLAQPLDDLAQIDDFGAWLIEDKYDGIRAQLHAANGRVCLFTRGLEDTTAAFPEVVVAFSRHTGPTILDGELLAWRGGRAMPFNTLQQRLARKRVTQQTLEQIPVIFLAYDLLMHQGRLMLDAPIEQRRAALEALTPQHVSPQQAARSRDHVEEQFLRARDRGNEGLLLKRRGSVYESGRRSPQWLKLKRPFATLDVVVTAAEQGHGRRAGVLSDLTFAVRAGDRYVNIGKAYAGLTDEQIRQMTRLLRAATVERFGRVSLVRPEIVIEVAFDGIQKSPRHKSGFALRFPRILRWRTDKSADHIDTLERVEELFGSA